MSARRELRAAESAWRASREGCPTARRFARTSAEAFRGADYASAIERHQRTPKIARIARFCVLAGALATVATGLALGLACCTARAQATVALPAVSGVVARATVDSQSLGEKTASAPRASVTDLQIAIARMEAFL